MWTKTFLEKIRIFSTRNSSLNNNSGFQTNLEILEYRDSEADNTINNI